jgi:hypothetical protein
MRSMEVIRLHLSTMLAICLLGAVTSFAQTKKLSTYE